MKNFVFIRGWASTDYSFKKFLQTVPVDIKVEMIGADRLIENQDLMDAAKKLDEYIQSKQIDKFVLAGHSLGGAVAIAYAATYPQKITQLYLINSVGFPFEGDFGKESLKMISRNSKKAFHNSDKKFFEAINFLSKPLFHLKLGKFARRINTVDIARKINLPTQILYGDADKLVSVTASQQIHQAVKGSILKILPNLDHDWIQTDPEHFWRTLDQAG